MSVIKITVDDQQLAVTDMPVIASGGVDENQIEFTFSSDWDDFACVAVFYREGECYSSLVDAETGLADIPYEATETDGRLYIGVMGTDEDEVTKTSELLVYKVLEGALTEDFDPGEPTPDIYNQILSYVSQVTSRDQRLAAVETLASTNESNIATNTTNIANEIATRSSADATINTRLDNLVANQTQELVTTLIESASITTGSNTLSDNVSNYDFIDLYFKEVNGNNFITSKRFPVSAFPVVVDIPTYQSRYVYIQRMKIAVSGRTLTISNVKIWEWDGTSGSNADVDSQGAYVVDLYRVDGVKIGHVANDEITDARIGFDDTAYQSLGSSIRGQASQLMDGLNSIEIQKYNRISLENITYLATYLDNTYFEIPGNVLTQTSNNSYHSLELDVSDYVGKTLVVFGSYGYDIYPLVFVNDENTVLAHYPTTRKTPLTAEEAEGVVPSGATKAYVSLSKGGGLPFIKVKVFKYEMDSDLAFAVNGVETLGIEGYERIEEQSILSDGVLVEGAYVEMLSSTSTSYQISQNVSYKYYKIPVTPGQDLKIYGLYGANLYPAIFVDDNDQYVGKYPTTKQTSIAYTEVETTVPSGAAYVFITGYINREIRCYDTNVLVFRKNSSAVMLMKNDDYIEVSSAFNNGTMKISANLHGSQNLAFCYDNYYFNGERWKTANDDITPLNFNNSYRAGGHGDDRGYTLTFASDHGLTESNIGELWTDANGVEVLICKIISTTSILVCIPLENPVSNYSPFNVATLVSPITNGSSSKAFSSSTRGQFAPIANHVSVTLAIDGVEVTQNGEYYGEYVDVIESYDLLYLPTMVEYLKSNVGSNTNESMYSDTITEKYCTINNVYRFTERGAITLFQSIDWYKSVTFNFAGMVQSQSIGDYISVPLTSKKQLSVLNSDSLYFNPDLWDNENIPPNRYYQYSGTDLSKGICLGYNTEIGTGIATNRNNINTAGFVYGSSHKLYPFVYSLSSGNNDFDTRIECVSYRVPMCIYDSDIPSIGWYYVGDDIYLLINVQNTVDKYISLPKKMVGRKVEAIETDGTISIPDNFVGAKGIKITTTNYGAAILKLSN